jgi:hypothetical protein
MHVRWMAVFLVLAVIVGCERRSAPLCTEGATVACACIGTLSGVQTCQHDGTLGVCVCAPPPPARPDNPGRPLPVIAPSEEAATDEPPGAPPIAPAPSAGSTPMDQARACLRNNSSNMAAGNQCVVQVLRGRSSSESELGLLAVTYRTMGRNGDAVRAMRTYIQHFPDGPRVSSFQQYIDNNSQ